MALTPPSRAGTNPLYFRTDDDGYFPLDLSRYQAGYHENKPIVLTIVSRGGASKDGKNAVLRGSKSGLKSTLDYWSNAFAGLGKRAVRPFRRIRKPSFLQSQQERRQNELLEKLKTVPIQHVTAPNSTVLPQDVVSIAAKRSGMLGSPLKTQAVQEIASHLKQWYERQGYVLHSMTGATLQVESQTAELSVQEPVSSHRPVEIVNCQEMVVNEDGSLTSWRQYRQDHAVRYGRTSRIDKSALNTTFVPSSGRAKTNPRRLAQALGLKSGQPFQWNPAVWSRIVGAGLFHNVLRASPERLQDGTVQLQLFVQEAPPRHLEYGITKSMYTGSWEGELDFVHKNVLGGGESLGVVVRRGTHDAAPSVRLSFDNDKFGLPGGYSVQVFADYIGEHLEESTGQDYEHDELLDRKGASVVLLRHPWLGFKGVPSTAVASVERTSTKGGRHESSASASLQVGPFARDLPMDARTSILGKVMVGSRLSQQEPEQEQQQSLNLLPFTSLTVTARQIFPLSSISSQPTILALQHSATTSSSNLPRHEANAQGVACNIRGYTKSNHRVANSVTGSLELRVSLPELAKPLADSKVVFFGDWSLAQAPASSTFSRRASVGLGLRKSFQGLPLKYDLTLTQEGKLGSFFGLGADFEA
jgi:outer membrane protein assembly factor BamA